MPPPRYLPRRRRASSAASRSSARASARRSAINSSARLSPGARWANMPRVRSMAARRSTAALSAFVACAMDQRIPADAKRPAENRKTRGLRTHLSAETATYPDRSTADPSTPRELCETYRSTRRKTLQSVQGVVMHEIDLLPVGKKQGDKCGDAIAFRFRSTDDEPWVQVVVDAGFKADGEALVEHVNKYYETGRLELGI